LPSWKYYFLAFLHASSLHFGLSSDREKDEKEGGKGVHLEGDGGNGKRKKKELKAQAKKKKELKRAAKATKKTAKQANNSKQAIRMRRLSQAESSIRPQDKPR
jgi:hypothetical protein